MRTFKIPVTWETYGVMEIEAETIEEAIKLADEDGTPYPSIDNNVDGSLEVNFEMIEHLNPLECIKNEPRPDYDLLGFTIGEEVIIVEEYKEKIGQLLSKIDNKNMVIVRINKEYKTSTDENTLKEVNKDNLRKIRNKNNE